MYSLGIDSGSTNTKGIIFDGQEIVNKIMVPTSAYPKASMEKVYESLYNDQVQYVVTTGYGRNLLEQADKKVTEITCHGQGSAFLHKGCQGVIDIGGQDCKAILLDKDSNIIDFVMNDKCAAGTGRFIEVMMRTLEADINEIDDFVKRCTPVHISSMCTVFAESEIISLLANGCQKGDIALGVIHSIAKRTAYFMGRLNLNGTVFFSGGLARFEVFQKALEEYLKLPVMVNPLSQYAGAIGAAVIGYRKANQ